MIVGSVSGATISISPTNSSRIGNQTSMTWVAHSNSIASNFVTGEAAAGVYTRGTSGSDPNFDRFFRTYLSFDTSGISANGTTAITSATLTVRGTAKSIKYYSADPSLVISRAYPSNPALLALADFPKVDRIPIANNITNTSYNANGNNLFTFTNLTCFDTGGYTTIVFWDNWDMDANFQGTWASSSNYEYQFNTSSAAANKPELLINYDIAPAAAFSGTPAYGIAPLAVTFTDESTNVPSTYHWDFGDGTTSTSQNPLHTYAAPGNYTVNLTVTNLAGTDSEVKTDYIMVATAPAACPINLATMYNVTGNGTDEAPALNAAFTYARSQGTCKVIFPTNAVIRFNSTINMSENLELDGQNATLKVSDNHGDGSGENMIQTAAHDWWHNLNYNGNSLGIGGSIDYGVKIADWVLIENSNFYNVTEYGLEGFHTSNWVFRNNLIQNSTQYGIATGGATGWSDNVTVTGNTIKWCEEVGVKIRGTKNAIANYNKVTLTTSGAGLRFYTNDAPVESSTIESNVITSNPASGTTYGITASPVDYCLGCVIRNNSIDGAYYGIYLGQDNANSSVLIENNIVTNTRRASVLVYGDNGRFYNNTFDRGAYLGAGSGNTPTNNTFRSNFFQNGILYTTNPLYGDGDGIFLGTTLSLNNVFDFNRINTSRYGFNLNTSFGNTNGTRITNNVITAGGACYLDLGNDTYYYNNTCNAGMEPVIVSFTGVQSVPQTGKKQVVLTDTSTGPTILSRIWTATEIGNSTPVSIGTASPLTVVFGAGNYSVVLNASAAIEANSTAANSYWVNVSASDSSSVPIADFTVNATTVCYGGTVAFTDQSTNASSWAWTFGDGATATSQNPEHTYNISSGYFNVGLTASNGLGTDTETKTNYINVQGSCGGGSTIPTAHPFSAATGSSMIVTAMGIIGLAIIGFGVAVVVGALSSQSTDGLVAGIFTIMLGGAILIISYMFLSPIMNLVA